MNIDLRFQDWSFVLQSASVRQYDDNAHRVCITGDYPEGWQWRLYVSVFSEAYFNEIPLTETDGVLSAVLTRDDLAFGDTNYTLQLVGEQGAVRRHTNTVRLYVGASLSADGVWPELPRSYADVQAAAEAAADRAAASAAEAAALIAGMETDFVSQEDFDAHMAEAEQLSSRLDTAVAAVSADSEVQDLRVGTDGTVYPTAGTAVRTQLDTLSALTVTTESRNLWNPDDPDYGDGLRLRTDGSTSSGNYNTSGYIRVHPGDVLYYSRLSGTTGNVVWVAYDALKTMVAGSGADAASYTVPSGAAFVRVCVYKPSDKATQIELDRITGYVPHHDPVIEVNSKKLSYDGAATNALTDIILGFVCYRGNFTDNTTGFVTAPIKIPDGAKKIYMRCSTAAKFTAAQFYDENIQIIPNSTQNFFLEDGDGNAIPVEASYIQLSGTGWDESYAGTIQLVFDSDVFTLLDAGIEKTSEKGVGCDAISIFGKREYPRTFFTSVAHRGYTPDAPENTLPALIAARKHGFDYAEIDVQFTSDHVPVLLHDLAINECGRNADGSAISGTINIRDITYEQALRYDFGIRYGAAFAGTKIPTFAEALSLCRDIGLHLHVEIKAESAPTQSDIETLVDLVRGWGMTEHVSWVSTATTQLARVHALLPRAELGVIVTTVDQSGIDAAVSLRGENRVFISSTDYGAEAVALCKAACLPMLVWTPNTRAEILALDPYVSGATSDRLHGGFTRYNDAMA